MKNFLSLTLCLLLTSLSFAKKVKFAVDMDTFAISPNGIHVTGDFQSLAGYPGGDWTSNETVCLQEGSSTIYSVIVDIPAFAKYEYKFVNGDQFYEVEFVPIESRVGYDFVDNRWIWVDSLANDTTFVGAIKFAGNAPAGLNLVRFLVNLTNQSTISTLPHLAGDFQNWNPAITSLYSFGDSIYEIINYLPIGSYQFKFINGNAWGLDEAIPSGCSVNNNRGIVVSKDTILTAFCFGSCTTCAPTSLVEYPSLKQMNIYPNPTADLVHIKSNRNDQSTIFEIHDSAGRLIFRTSETKLILSKNDFGKGIYFVTSIDKDLNKEVQKLVFY